MSENARKTNEETSTPCVHLAARELCRKAKETLEKANKLLADSEKHPDPVKQNKEAKNS